MSVYPKGEELFLDYGDSWQQAWDEHVANWEPPKDAEKYVYPEEMDDTETLRTVKEQEKDPYPASVMVRTKVLRPNDVHQMILTSHPNLDHVFYSSIRSRSRYN